MYDVLNELTSNFLLDYDEFVKFERNGLEHHFDKIRELGAKLRKADMKGDDDLYQKIADEIVTIVKRANGTLNESKKSARKSIKESYEYEDIKNETPIIDVWGNSEGTHIYEVFKINSDYVYYEYNYRKHDSTMITDGNEIEVIIRLMDYLPTKFIVKQEDKIGMLESAIANIKAIDKHYGKLKKYNSNYYWQAVRFIKNSMLKDDDPDASNYFDEADDIINDALEQNGDSFRV